MVAEMSTTIKINKKKGKKLLVQQDDDELKAIYDKINILDESINDDNTSNKNLNEFYLLEHALYF